MSDDEIVCILDTRNNQKEKDRQITREVNNLIIEQENTQNRVIAPSPQLMVAIRQSVEQRQEYIRRMSIDIQRMLIPYGEDVYLISDMMLLKEEVVQHIDFQFLKNKVVPPPPVFYSSTIYFLYKQATCQRMGPIYLQQLGNVVTLRIKENYPAIKTISDYPSLKSIIEFYSRFEMGNGPDFFVKKEESQRQFEVVLGEAFQYINLFHKKHGTPPAPPQFLIKFCILMHQLGFQEWTAESFDVIVVDRLRRNLRNIDQRFFDSIRDAFGIYLKRF
ncbi:uncharacterized protein CELE_C16C10.9 [Caenorhabditis elegans]|uniref:Uncharacterized protein C16C10.9 n=1 Tax=Caenorhabditis elegans TaxID=6239 RepID=YQ59_CAEEL|nr:Uncharacterized protein CELE_C16C10.9 [Caenorhabditis elegans]Q09465.1 RecName: Full=Uncharacterized protein C16C10.9 [Caenorhabditis elegans]CAA86747.1 Uncharacterized protein CELE_C16C10.9 [Caenorhabditis elegans]|eukprot:NP_497828.1 Uncharacterized protein CELE_C16C10.9 [Caenorhabditis elegans]